MRACPSRRGADAGSRNMETATVKQICCVGVGYIPFRYVLFVLGSFVQSPSKHNRQFLVRMVVVLAIIRGFLLQLVSGWFWSELIG